MGYQTRPVLLGLLIIALGIVWLLNNLGFVHVNMSSLVRTYWPVLFIVWGVDLLARIRGAGADGKSKKRDSGGLLTGVLFIGIGAALLGRNVGLFDFNFGILWRAFWPALLILVGWSLLKSATGTGKTQWAFMSGIELRNKGWKVESSSFIAFMGGVDLDLTVAEIPDREITLNLTAIMGGIKVRVPPEPEIVCDGTAIMGGIKFFQEEGGGIIASSKAEYEGVAGTKKKLVIAGRALMGGIEVVRETVH